MQVLTNLKYSKDHEWVKVEGNIATIGITDYAQLQLGDVVFVDLPEEGASIETGKEFAAIESVKAVSDIYAPISGTIKKVNIELTDAPETINEDVYGRGWIVQVEITNTAELDSLLTGDQYEDFLKEE